MAGISGYVHGNEAGPSKVDNNIDSIFFGGFSGGSFLLFVAIAEGFSDEACISCSPEFLGSSIGFMKDGQDKSFRIIHGKIGVIVL